MSGAMTQKRFLPWFGSDAMIAKPISQQLRGCKHVTVVFAGGMSIVPELDASSIVVNDLHRAAINLACVISIPEYRERVTRYLSDLPFHPDVLKAAQAHCIEMERGGWDFSNINNDLSERWAINYFICSWMGRSGRGGTEDEFKGNLSVRWSASGGDSNKRYRSAVSSLDAWSEAMRRCQFSCMDYHELLCEKCKDIEGNGVYSDAPWPDDGNDYKHKFTERNHRELAEDLSRFTKARVVVRYGDHPLIRELYPPDKWNVIEQESRTQGNNGKAELLIVNGPGYGTAV